MKNFEIIDISGDVGLRAYGENLRDAFINAAIGMFSLITDLEMVKEEKVITVSVESDSVESLLVSWLNELIFYFDTYGFLGKKVLITEFTPSLLKATISGEDFDPKRHESKLLIKAATYHMLKIEEKNRRWEIAVIFDI